MYIPATYTDTMVQYYAEYFKTVDYSFPIFENNHKIGFWPGLIRNQIYPPMFFEDVSDKVQKKHIERILDFIYFHKLQEHQFADFSYGEISLWHQSLLEYCHVTTIKIQYYHYIDFNKYLKIRKSYKNLYNQYKDSYPAQVITDSDVMDAFRLKHFEVAGRETRSRETWNLQAQMLQRNQAFVVVIPDLAYSFFNYSADECLYSVAVYDREIDAPLGHISLITAIKYAHNILGCKGFNLGDAVFAGDLKEQKISYFKSGFSNELRPKYVGSFRR
jgi:hypothetical protein